MPISLTDIVALIHALTAFIKVLKQKKEHNYRAQELQLLGSDIDHISIILTNPRPIPPLENVLQM